MKILSFVMIGLLTTQVWAQDELLLQRAKCFINGKEVILGPKNNQQTIASKDGGELIIRREFLSLHDMLEMYKNDKGVIHSINMYIDTMKGSLKDVNDVLFSKRYMQISLLDKKSKATHKESFQFMAPAHRLENMNSQIPGMKEVDHLSIPKLSKLRNPFKDYSDKVQDEIICVKDGFEGDIGPYNNVKRKHKESIDNNDDLVFPYPNQYEGGAAND